MANMAIRPQTSVVGARRDVLPVDRAKRDFRLVPIEAQGIAIDPVKWTVFVNNEPISLTSLQFRTLYVLASNAGRTLSRQQIIECIHGPNGEVTEHAFNLRIRAIRKRLGEYGRLIRTVRGIGYTFSTSSGVALASASDGDAPPESRPLAKRRPRPTLEWRNALTASQPVKQVIQGDPRFPLPRCPYGTLDITFLHLFETDTYERRFGTKSQRQCDSSAA
jgi:DNA-binding winged helix-turn-helix (wHTH) protein